MKIKHLSLKNFRNLSEISIQFGPRVNLFHGLNGSGKTSLLEAIHYLALGRSFRTRNLSRIIQQGADSFALIAQVFQDNLPSLPIGIERHKARSQITLRIGGKTAHALIELAQRLPFQLINADSHQLLTSGPLVRRQFLDWGVFHVEPSFYSCWQRANRIIKQRNTHLKKALSYSEIALWDDELELCAEQLDAYRRKYIEELTPLLAALLEKFLEGGNYYLHYSSGWNSEQSLKKTLSKVFTKDKQVGYTQYGPQRADLQLKINNIPAHDILSQGQQKLAAYALRLSQGMLLHQQTGKNCLFLIDDLPSELDQHKRRLVANIINKLDAQTFITGIEKESLGDLSTDAKMFHVKHGSIYISKE